MGDERKQPDAEAEEQQEAWWPVLQAHMATEENQCRKPRGHLRWNPKWGKDEGLSTETPPTLSPAHLLQW